MYPTPEYRVLVRKFAGPYDYSPGPVIAEIVNWYNLGWADYVNDVPEAFFTILQKEGDSLANLLRDYEGRAHVQIYRNGTLVWAGWLMEYDGQTGDAVFYCYGYLSGLYWQVTNWNVVYIDKKVGEIVETEWLAARNRQMNIGGQDRFVSMLHWITTGLIQHPVTTTGGSTDLILPEYKLYNKRLLFMLRELASISMSDTQNTVMFDITPGGQFRFLKDSRDDKPNLLFEYGDDQVANFRHLRAAVNRRNSLRGVGSSPMNLVLRSTQTRDGQIDAWGLREEAMYVAWVRDQTALQRVTKHRLARANRIDNDIALQFYPNSVQPPHKLSGQWNLTDRCRVIIDHGTSNFNGWLHAVGQQTVISRAGAERVQVMFQETVGI